MIHVTDPAIPNLDIVGIMAADQCFFNYQDLSCPCESCEGILIEAWERMTYGGMLISRSMSRLPVHRDWDQDQLGVSHGYLLSHFRFEGHLRGTVVTR